MPMLLLLSSFLLLLSLPLLLPKYGVIAVHYTEFEFNAVRQLISVMYLRLLVG